MKTFLILAAAILVGAASGYYGAMRASVPAQIAVIDIDALVKAAADLTPGDPKAAEALTERLKKRAGELTAKGIVVLDSKAVINAPRAAYVDFE